MKTAIITRISFVVLIVLGLCGYAFAGQTIYVDDDADGANDGSSWADAFNYLQDALADAADGDEIRVAQGIYKPDQGVGITPGDRNAAFKLINGVTLKGCYAGFGESDPDARNITAYKTILSGDLAGNDVEVGDPCALIIEPSRSENSERILMVGLHEDTPPVLDGFTITGGSSDYSGGGIVMDEGDLIVVDCIFMHNSAGYSGGVITGWNSRVIFERCRFIRNAAAGDGGAIFTDSCTCRQAYLACIDCVFINNSAGGNGGAIRLSSMIPMLTSFINCLIIGNKAGGYGSALYDDTQSGSGWLVNCTLSGNSAKGAGPCGGWGYSSVSLTSCILWDNMGQAICSGDVGFKYSNVEDGPTGDGNIDSDPCFVGPGYWDADGLWIDGDYHLLPGSLCIEAGDPDFVVGPHGVTIPEGDYYNWDEGTSQYVARSSERDLDGNPRMVGVRVDMGAYESSEVPICELTVTVVSGHGTVEPDSGSYYAGTVVTLTATPEVGYIVRLWTGTDDDTSCGLTNTVTMDSDKTVTVEFGQPRAFVVGGDPNVVTIQQAIDAAGCGDVVVLNAGVYFEDINFNGKDIRVTSTNPDDPCVVAYTIIQGTGSGPVVTFSGGESQNCVLDGLTITGGNATGNGGGICGNGTEATIFNCVITNNHANGVGGGVSNCSGTIVRCAITGNTANRGGGVGNTDCIVTIKCCTFASNSAAYGSGIYGLLGEMTVINCSFSANIASRGGGALFNSSANATFLNCTFSGNSNDEDDIGGGLESNSGIQSLINCTFSGNVGAIEIYDDSVLKMQNCIVANDRGQLYFESGNVVKADYCCIPDWVIQQYGGTGNFDADPRFVDPDGNDNIFGTEDDNLRLLPDSLCINAGDPNYVPGPGETDLDGNPRLIGDRVDMGAYEFQGIQILYVDDGAAQFGDGSSWATAFKYLQDALFNAVPPAEIRVAQGIYKPHLNTYSAAPPSRTDTFQLRNGVTIKGGYAGLGQQDPDARDINLYKTILSGDMNGDDVAVNDPCDLLTEPTRAENSYHVVSAVGTDTTAVLDGFTIVAGNADHPISWPEDHRSYGGGLYIEKWRHATVLNCTFTNNSGRIGGAIYYDHGKPVINDCCFVANAANKKGGGISDGWSSKAAVTNCTFNNNRSLFGGGMFTCGSETILTRCTFNANRAYHGGGMYNEISDPIANSCLFAGNWARYGGAIYNEEESEPIFINCTFSGNAAPYDPYNETGGDGGAINNWGGSLSNLTNCILWGDSPDEISGGRNLVNFCCIQGWTASIGGMGNIDADPCFTEPGYWADANDPNIVVEPNHPCPIWIDGDYNLLLSSSCIDAGDPNFVAEPDETDLDGNPRVIGGRIDMGAYEFCGPVYVDDDAPNDPGSGDPGISDPLEDGTEAHPFDTIQEAVNMAVEGYTVLVRQGSYFELGTSKCIDFLGKNITLTSADPTDWDIVYNTIVRGYVQFSGTEGPNCKFTGFRISSIEGAIYGNHTHTTISHCNISGNGPCGATVIRNCDGIISNCLITDNTTFFRCGVFPIIFGCNGLIKNCTIANNESGLFVDTATIENCIIYNNIGSQLAVTNGNKADISYSNVQNGLAGIVIVGDGHVSWGPGNIDTDPCFVRLGYWIMDEMTLIEGDYHLGSEGWRWNTDSKSWTYDFVTSRCVDAGNPGSRLRGELMSVPRDPDNVWGINLRINMGAFGGTSQASMPPHDWALLADLNNDGTANFVDFAYQAQDWLTTAPELPGDLNRDGVLNTMDLALLAEEWLKVTVWIE